MMKKSNKKGFTLVELIVVIAIMAILAAVLVPTVTSKVKEAKKSAAESDAQALAKSFSLALAESKEDCNTLAAAKALFEKAGYTFETDTNTIKTKNDTFTIGFTAATTTAPAKVTITGTIDGLEAVSVNVGSPTTTP